MPSAIFQPIISSIIYIINYCSGDSTLVTEYIEQYSGVNTTTGLIMSPCSLGCSNTTNTCVDLTQTTNYSYISIFSIIILIMFLFISFYLSNSRVIKILFGILIALLLVIVVSIAIEPSTITDNEIIKQIGTMNMSIYFVLSIVVVSLILVITILSIINHFKKKKNMSYGIINEYEEED